MIYFSIIIPVYRDEKRLRILLNQLNRQTFRKFEWEVLIINNDSESILDIKEEFGFPMEIILETIPGSYAARNAGIKHSRGDIIAFTDADCLPEPNWLQNAFEAFQKDKKRDIGILTGPVSLFFKDENNLSPAELYEKYTGGFTTEAYAKEGRAITANWFSYKSVIKEFGGFDAKLKSNGDSDLSGKISEKYKIQYNSDLMVHHPARFHTSELVNKYKRLLGGVYTRKFEGNTKAFRKHLVLFLWARYRFALKRLFILSPKESLPILQVCNAINMGVIQEYFDLIQGGETKR